MCRLCKVVPGNGVKQHHLEQCTPHRLLVKEMGISVITSDGGVVTEGRSVMSPQVHAGV